MHLDFLHHKLNTMNNEEGQSTIEFLSCISIAFTFVFLFIKIALNYTDGYMVQYATFMAARTYLVMDNTSPNDVEAINFAEREAIETFKSYQLEKFIEGFDGDIDFRSPRDNIVKAFVGAVVKYTGVLSYSKAVGGKEPLNFTSEAYLGKEPTRGECANRVCVGIMGSGVVSSCKDYVTLFDNGC